MDDLPSNVVRLIQRYHSLKIPKIIHFIWVGSQIPEKYIYNILNVAIGNPNFIVYVWLDHPQRYGSYLKRHDILLDSPNISLKNVSAVLPRILRLIPRAKYLLPYYERERIGVLANYAAAADILRLLILYIYGGIYLDTDIKLSRSYSQNTLLNLEPKFYIHVTVPARPGSTKFVVNNDLIATPSKSYIIKRSIELVIQRYINANPEILWSSKRKPEIDVLKRTNQLVQRVGDAMRAENIDYTLLDKYYTQMEEINRSRDTGRLAQTLKLSGPGIIHDVLVTLNVKDFEFPIQGFDISNDSTWTYRSDKKFYPAEI